MAKLYRANGIVENVFPEDGETFTLEELQNFVGGYIERLDMLNGYAMYVNEEGKLNNLPDNIIASEKLARTRYILNVVVGDAVVLSNEEEE